MKIFKAENKIIISNYSNEIPNDLFNNTEEQDTKTIKSNEVFRAEHPNCAFFKSVHKSGDNEYSRKTLYTSEGRLHIDFDTSDDDLIQISKYVKKDEQLDVLLFYLRDIKIFPSLKNTDEESKIIEMPDTPLVEFYKFTCEDVFLKAITEDDMTVKHILHQLKRIYNDKLNILAQKLKEKTEYAVFDDIPTVDISEDIIENWHYYYIRKYRLLK